MAFLEVLSSLLLLASLTDGGAVLEPAGLVALCPGDNLTFTCTIPQGKVLWEISTVPGSLFLENDPSIPPVNHGIFSVRVVSVVSTNGSTVVTSTATTINSLQPISDGVEIRCRDTINLSLANATLSIAEPTQPSLSADLITGGTNTMLLLSWSMSDCAVQYVVTIINSSDGSVYPNITTSDTNTTVTLPTGVEYCVTVLGVDHSNRTGPASELQCYSESKISTVIRSSSTSVQSTQRVTRLVTTTATQTLTASFSATPSPTIPPVGDDSVIATVVPIVLVIILAVMLMITSTALIFMCLRKKRKKREKLCSPHGADIPERLPESSIELKNLPAKSPMLASKNAIFSEETRFSSGEAFSTTMSLPVYVNRPQQLSRESSRVAPPQVQTSPSSQPKEDTTRATTADNTIPSGASEHTLNLAESKGSLTSLENPSEMESVKFQKSESTNGRISKCRTTINCEKDNVR